MHDQFCFSPSTYLQISVFCVPLTQVSLGLLGIITEVTFQCVSAFDLEETSEPTDLADCIRDLDTIINSAPFIKLWVEIYSSKCVVFRYNKTEKPRQESVEIWKMDLKVNS